MSIMHLDLGAFLVPMNMEIEYSRGKKGSLGTMTISRSGLQELDNQQFVGLSLFLVGAVFALFIVLVGPLLLVPGLVILYHADRKRMPCRNCTALFRISQKRCPKCGTPRA